MLLPGKNRFWKASSSSESCLLRISVEVLVWVRPFENTSMKILAWICLNHQRNVRKKRSLLSIVSFNPWEKGGPFPLGDHKINNHSSTDLYCTLRPLV